MPEIKLDNQKITRVVEWEWRVEGNDIPSREARGERITPAELTAGPSTEEIRRVCSEGGYVDNFTGRLYDRDGIQVGDSSSPILSPDVDYKVHAEYTNSKITQLRVTSRRRNAANSMGWTGWQNIINFSTPMLNGDGVTQIYTALGEALRIQMEEENRAAANGVSTSETEAEEAPRTERADATWHEASGTTTISADMPY